MNEVNGETVSITFLKCIVLYTVDGTGWFKTDDLTQILGNEKREDLNCLVFYSMM